MALLAAMALGLTALLGRLLVLQVRDASALEALALNQRVRSITLHAARGSLLDRSGQALAMSLPAKAVYADPALVKDPLGESSIIATALDVDQPSVFEKLNQRGHFVYLARQVDVAVARRLQAQDLPGIGFLDESRRFYPAGALGPQVVGFVGVDGQGLAGLELEYQKVLAGRTGHEVVQEDPSGTLIPQASTVDVQPLPGDDVVTTIDREIQYQAQISLAAAVKANHAKGGSILVMDPRTGDVLAMASDPWFDPNRGAQADPDTIRNRAVTDAYEPGSVNKVITASAALEQHILTLTQRMTVPDHYQLYTKVFHDAEPHPTEQMTLGDIIAYSSNIGTIQTAAMLGRFRFASYLYKFGLARTTGSGFPGESPGILPPPGDWSGTGMGTIPIGQGIAVTPLQMACVYGAIANGGVLVQPRFVRGFIDPDGHFQPARAAVTRRAVSEQTAHTVTRLLAYGVDVGTGQRAQIPGYWVAGKTGTARKLLPNGTGYYSDRYVASFIGFAPAARPALVVAAVLDEPQTVFGGIASAPLFQRVMRFALARLRVPSGVRLPIPPHAIPTP